MLLGFSASLQPAPPDVIGDESAMHEALPNSALTYTAYRATGRQRRPYEARIDGWLPTPSCRPAGQAR